MKKNKENKRGSVLVFVAISLAVLAGFAGMALDIGMTVHKKALLQHAVDAAALAGAQELPDSTSDAYSVAESYLEENVGLSNLTSYTITFSELDRKIRVEASEDVDYFFAKVIGFEKGEVVTKAAAIRAAVEIVDGNIRPFGVEDKDYSPGEIVTLRFGAGGTGKSEKEEKKESNGSGNYGLLEFGVKHKEEGHSASSGADFLAEMILNGSYVDYGLGDELPTLTGIAAQKVLKSMEALVAEGVTEIVIPLIGNVVEGEELDLTGKTTVRITGFAAFNITEYKIDAKGTGQVEIVGSFIEIRTPGQADLNTIDTGVTAVSLVE